MPPTVWGCRMSSSLHADHAAAPAVITISSTTARPGGSEPGYQIIRRNGAVTPFDPTKIAVALTKAFLGVEGSSAAASRRVHDIVEDLTREIVSALTRRAEAGRTFHIEDVQDQVELALMRAGHQKVARAYVLYREERAAERAKAIPQAVPAAPSLQMRLEDGTRVPLDMARLSAIVSEACEGLADVSAEAILTETMRNPLRRHHRRRTGPGSRPGCPHPDRA